MGDGLNGASNKVTIIAWSGNLDRAYPILILATTAAASGMDVTIFFTFWGLFILKRNDRGITGKDWMTKMLALMTPGGTEHLGLSRLHMAGMGSSMMRKVFRKNNIASLQELLDMARELGVKLLPCQMTMDALGLTKDDLIEGLGEPAGAATALEEAAGSRINWFI
jgi:peroxiredoxin family protein